MSLAAIAVEKKALTYFATFLLVVAGLVSFGNLGQLEDPEFTIKTATVITQYPGASPLEVEQEVTEPLELAIQEMAQVDEITSMSRAGLSIITVDIHKRYKSPDLPQVWDELRKKVRDARGDLPPGAGAPSVNDDFSDVFGFLLAVTGDGYSYAELEDRVTELKRELSLVEGAAKVSLWGVQPKVIYLDVSQSQASTLGISSETLLATLQNQNQVADAGGLDLGTERFRFEASGTFKTPEDIGNLTFRANVLEEAQGRGAAAAGELIRLRDVATIRRGYWQPAQSMMRFNGTPALGVAVSNVAGANVVDLGAALDKRLRELEADLPVGIEIHRVAWQSDLITESIDTFVISLAEAVAIVLVVLWLVMGWRMGVIIGTALVLTILGTFLVMALWGIDLQRMSLGALVIALGMMVDNSIVVADGIYVRLQQGMERGKAVVEAAQQPAWPLLGATVVAVMAFFPIYASPGDTGEYCASLFQVVAVALLVSWVISMTITPLQCLSMLKVEQGEEGGAYSGTFYVRFRALLTKAIQARWLTIGIIVALLVTAVLGFGGVRQMFFPASARLQLMIDYWGPEGTRIEKVSADLARLERHLAGDDRVADVASFIGMGPPRFYLPVEPEKPYSSYGQLILNMNPEKGLEGINSFIAEYEPWIRHNVPEAMVRVRRYALGPSNTFKFEVRFGGGANADVTVLRDLADQGVAIMESSPFAKEIRNDWRTRVKKVVTDYSQERGRWSGVSRVDMASATKRTFDGLVVGQYREGDDLLPIIARSVELERQNVENMSAIQVVPSMSSESVPLAQVVDGIHVAWEDPIIWRKDRRRVITVQGEPMDGVTLGELMSDVRAEFEAMNLPPGYWMEWGGEYEDSKESQEDLLPGVVPAVGIIVLTIVALFNAYRPPLIILLAIPFALIGITAGLLMLDAPFGFMALLGAMSLAGMMIKNSIVLLDQIDLDLAEGKPPFTAVMDSALSRLRPVALAAGTTILGVVPLLPDVFWFAMAVTIMGGLAFGTVLTMVLVPVLYATLFKIKVPAAT